MHHWRGHYSALKPAEECLQQACQTLTAAMQMQLSKPCLRSIKKAAHGSMHKPFQRRRLTMCWRKRSRHASGLRKMPARAVVEEKMSETKLQFAPNSNTIAERRASSVADHGGGTTCVRALEATCNLRPDRYPQQIQPDQLPLTIMCQLGS